MGALTEFESHLRATCGSARTVIAYVADSREFIAFLAGRPASVGAVEEWIASLNHGRRKAQTVARKLAGVRRFLGHAARHGDEAAAKTLVVLRDYKVTPAVRQADVEQVRAITRGEFLGLRKRADARMRALLDTVWWTGARISEVVGDDISGIPALTVADALLLVRQGFVQAVGKGGRIRTLVSPPGGREALRLYVEEEARRAGSSRPLFEITAQGVNSSLHRLGFSGGIHSFRHAYRARLRRGGVGEDIARALLGHGPKNVTAGYGQPTVEELLAAVERLE